MTGRDGRVIDDAVVTFGATILACGAASSTSLDPSIPVEKYPAATLLPGLIDAHCHLTLAADGRTYEQMNLDSNETLAATAARNLVRHLASGVTTLRDNGGRDRVMFDVRDAAYRGRLAAPTMLLSGRPITPTGGHFYWCNGVADGADEIRATVRRLIAEGADHIKIMASGGGTVGTFPQYASYTADELRAAVGTAHDLGRLTTAHCRATRSIEYALDAGLDCIEHAEFLVPTSVDKRPSDRPSETIAPFHVEYDDAVADRILESEAYVGCTLQAGTAEGSYGTLLRLRAEPEATRRADDLKRRMSHLDEYYDSKLDTFRRLMDAGLKPKLVVSSDAGPSDVEFGRLSYGLELAVAGGMTRIEAIESATRVAAEACGVADRVGTVQVGKRADLLLVDGDPLADLACLDRVLKVYLGGMVVIGDA